MSTWTKVRAAGITAAVGVVAVGCGRAPETPQEPEGAAPNQSGFPGLWATRQNSSRTPSASIAGLT